MHSIYIKNIALHTQQCDLENLFAQYGVIKDVNMMKDIKTGQLKGDALITFATTKSAIDALSENGQEFEGRLLKVSVVHPDS